MTDKKDKKNEPKRRLTADERHRLLLDAAIPLFAREGFRGVTTKMLAKEAGVSEALLYQHFPSKEAIYSEVLDHYCTPPVWLKASIDELVPSTESLVLLNFFVAKAAITDGFFHEKDDLFPRLMLNSLAEDGVFARLHMQRTVIRLVALMSRCLAAARDSGDLLPGDDMPDDLRALFSHNLIIAVHLNLMHTPPVAPYPADRGELVRHIMRYVLRGLGLTEKALKQYFDYERLEARVNAWLARQAKEG